MLKMAKEKKNIIGWEEILENPPEAYRLWFEGEKEFLTENITKNSKVLEVGCGDGRSLKDVLEITPNIVGVDNDKTAVEHAREKLKGYPNAKILLAEGKNLPFKDNTFDYSTCIGTFANLGEQKFEILEEMKRVTKSDGHIIITVYSEDALEERMKMYKKIIPEETFEAKSNGTVIFKEFGQNNVSEQFSEKQLKDVFNKVDLKINKIKKAGIAYLCLLSK